MPWKNTAALTAKQTVALHYKVTVQDIFCQEPTHKRRKPQMDFGSKPFHRNVSAMFHRILMLFAPLRFYNGLYRRYNIKVKEMRKTISFCLFLGKDAKICVYLQLKKVNYSEKQWEYTFYFMELLCDW